MKGVVSGNEGDSNNPNSQHIKNRGPLPVGDYWIGQAYDRHPEGRVRWTTLGTKLYGDDGNGGKSYTDIPVKAPDGSVVHRGLFNLHTGRESDGWRKPVFLISLRELRVIQGPRTFDNLKRLS